MVMYDNNIIVKHFTMNEIGEFIARWKASGGSEQANSQLFLAELCAVLGLPIPEPAKPVNEENTYSFERKVYVTLGDGTKKLKKLDAHRKSRQLLHPELTLTGMYNVLDALRSGRELTDKEKNIYEYGLVRVLRELHDELDAAVADAYDWPVDLSNEEILTRLVALNAERSEEEKDGKIRWLRPEYQTKSKEERKEILKSFDFVPIEQPAAEKKKTKASKAKTEVKTVWPSDILEQTQAVRNAIDALREAAVAVTPSSVAERFTRAPRARVQEILQALETLGFV